MPSWETPVPGPADSNHPWQIFLPPGSSPLKADIRGTERTSYRFAQRFAPYREGRWPDAAEFHPVELCDISSAGLALIMEDRPVCSHFVVELGMGTNVSQVLVQVIQVTPVAAAFGSEEETPHYRVGCEILSSPRA